MGRIGPGDFPPPLNPDQGTTFFSWTEVATWLREHNDIVTPTVDATLRAANLAVQLRALVPAVGVEHISRLILR